jgi:lysophospholipase L1-like esterase
MNLSKFAQLLNFFGVVQSQRSGAERTFSAGGEVVEFIDPALQQDIDSVIAAASSTHDAQLMAELARDAAQAAATLYPDEATGRADVLDGEYFRVVGSGNVACHIYRRTNSGASTLIVSLSSDSAIKRPSWTGRRSGWPDPFFRLFDLTSQTFLGRDRWYWNTVGAEFQGWEMVANSIFSGRALRRVVSGNVPLSGPAIWLDELGAAAGDTITVYALVTGNGCVFGGYGRFANSLDVHLGDQVVMLNLSGIASTTLSTSPTLMRVTATAPANTTKFNFYPITNTAGGTFEIVALWAHKGAVGAGPDWPVFSDGDYLGMQVAEVANLLNPVIVTPPLIFGVQGRECNVYLDNLFVADAADHIIDVDSSALVGSQQAERYTWVPSAALASGTLTVKVHDKRSGTLLASKVIQQRAAASSAGSGSTKKVLFIGDSLVGAGVITQTLLDISGADVMGISLRGTRGTAPNVHEGRGGWSISDYSTAGRTYYSFTVSGVVTPPAIGSTTYTNNGNTYTVQDLFLTDGSGTIICSVSPLNGAPTAAGTLTKASGSGDSVIAFAASAAVPGNPFWIGGGLDFAQYLTDRGFDAPDWVIIGLGINDVFGQTTDAGAAAAADAAFTLLDGLINSIKAADAGIKVALMIPSPPAASQDAFAANYATGQTRWRSKRNVLIWSRQLIAKYAGQEASRVYLLPSNVALDTVNNYDRSAAAPVNSRATSVMIARQNNGVHPGVTGYQQLADSIWAFLKFYA